jgi:hypothetical protein
MIRASYEKLVTENPRTPPARIARKWLDKDAKAQEGDGQ